MDMSREKRISLMSQEGPLTIRYMTKGKLTREELGEELEKRPHLNQCSELMDSESSDRVVLICDTIRQGLDACHTVVDILALKHGDSKAGKKSSAQVSDEEEDELELFFKDLEIDLGEEEPCGRTSDEEGDEDAEENPLEQLCNEPDSYVIYSEKEIDGGACNDLGESPDKMMMLTQKKTAMLPQAAAAFIVKCDGMVALSEETLDLVLELKEKPMILVVPKQKANHKKIDRLLFEGGFEVIETSQPSLEYLCDQFCTLMENEGFSVDPQMDLKGTIRTLKRERGEKFGERDMIFLAKAVQKKQRQTMSCNTVIQDIAVPRYTMGETSGKKLMDRIVGLEAVKETLEMEINRQAYRNRLVEELSRRGEATDDYVPCRNMAFCGNPGTCKTTMARAMAVRMGEMGITNGIFLEVSREQLVGRYMGETSLKVAKVFEKAKGGVLFIDEAGSLATDSGDHYAEEAVSAIVRHMENDRDTVVIFATYNDDMESLMATNEGLRSRIGRMIHFEDYTPEQLTKIFCSMAASRGYHLEDGAEFVLDRYFKKASQRKDFGGGREARRLLDQAEGQMANLAMRNQFSGEQLFLLTIGAIEEAADCLLGEAKGKEIRRPIGFAPKTVVG